MKAGAHVTLPTYVNYKFNIAVGLTDSRDLGELYGLALSSRPPRQRLKLCNGKHTHQSHRPKLSYMNFAVWYSSLWFLLRDAMHARYMLRPCLYPSIRPSVCPSVTSRCSTKTAKCRITQTTPHDSTGTLVFWCQRSPRNSTVITPPTAGAPNAGGLGQHRRLSTNSWLYLENGTR